MTAQKKQSASQKKLVQEIVVLVVIVVVIGGFSIYKFGLNKSAAPMPAPSLNTTFNAKPLTELKDKGSEYPDVTPSKDELGKPNPFAP